MIKTYYMMLQGDVEGMKWVAQDSVTNFCGVGDTEHDAVTKLANALSNHIAQLRQWRTYPSTIPFSPLPPPIMPPMGPWKPTPPVWCGDTIRLIAHSQKAIWDTPEEDEAWAFLQEGYK